MSIQLGSAFDLLPTVPEASIRLLLTDPPYAVSRKNGLKSMGRSGIDFGDWDYDFDQLGWLSLAAPAICPGGSIVIFNDWKNLGDIAKELTRLRFEVKRKLIWQKSNPSPRNLNRSFVQGTEEAIWAVKKSNKTKWVFNRRPGNAYETGIFKFPVQTKKKHPTKKPDGLFQAIIEILTNPGDTVLDPFAGSGTTAYAAEVSGRKHLSFELNPEYHQLAIAHWKTAQKTKNPAN